MMTVHLGIVATKVAEDAKLEGCGGG